MKRPHVTQPDHWPNLFLLGAPKCGTTSLTHWMSQHPDIWMSRPKEPGYFNTDYKDGPFRGKTKQYQRLFASDRLCRWFCDGTVDYLASECAIANIQRVSPCARYIVAVRNHADLVFSMYQEERVSGNELIQDFTTAYDLSAQRRMGREIPITRPEPRKIDYVTRAGIGAQLERAARLVGREKILVVDFQMICAEPEAVWNEICAFLGIEVKRVDMTPQNIHQNVTSIPMTILRKYLRQTKRSFGLTRNYGLDRPIVALSAQGGGPRPQLQPSMRARLDADFADDLKAVRAAAQSGPAIISPGGWLDHG